MATLHHFLKGSVVNDKKIREVSHTYREQINIKTPSVDTKVVSLSGGTSRRSFWPSGWCAIATYSSSTSRPAAST